MKFMNQLATVVLNTNAVISQSLKKTRLAGVSPGHSPQSQGRDTGSPRLPRGTRPEAPREASLLRFGCLCVCVCVSVYRSAYRSLLAFILLNPLCFGNPVSCHYLWQRPPAWRSACPQALEPQTMVRRVKRDVLFMSVWISLSTRWRTKTNKPNWNIPENVSSAQ